MNETCGVSRAPVGYYCSRDYYHSGPCAAIPIEDKASEDQLTALREENKRLQGLINQVDDVLTDNWIVAKNGDYKATLNELIGFNIQIALDPAVNGGDTLFTRAECKILHTLVDGFEVGPDARKVLDKLKGAAA